MEVSVQDLALVRGLRDTRSTLAVWNAEPGPVVRAWIGGALLVTGALLAAVWVVASITTPDPTGIHLAGLHTAPTVGAAAEILGRNSLVLALHAMACVAGFIAGSSLPREAERYGGRWRWIHDRAGPLAISFVVAATTFSLITQAWTLGQGASTLAAELQLGPVTLLAALLPHAVPELVALFLPLAAWMIASRRGDWHELLAATFVTVAVAVPALVLSAAVEVWVTPRVLAALAG
jgi:hypothetical protein